MLSMGQCLWGIAPSSLVIAVNKCGIGQVHDFGGFARRRSWLPCSKLPSQEKRGESQGDFVPATSACAR